ncbi:hypothetical protein GQ457_11G021190 [Hibiscus cannabinus]
MTQPELVAPISAPFDVDHSGASSGGSVTQSVFTNKKVNVVLDELNFLVWKQQVLLAVCSLRLEKLLTGALKPPSATVRSANGTMVENKAYEVFVAQDSALASWLLSTISTSLLPQFVEADTAAEIWSIILRFFASRSTTTVMSLHYKLRSLKKGDMSMRAYVSQVKEICNALASSGSPISDLETIATILNGLSVEYQPFVAVITASREPFTLDAAISVLLDAEVQLSSFNPLSDISSTLNVVQASVATLDTAKEGSTTATRPYRQASTGRGRSGRMRLQCQLCGKLGHLVDRCWHRFDENFVPVTARSKDSSKSEVNSVFVANHDLDSHGCSCHCAGAGSSISSDGISASAKSPQVNLVAAKDDHWFIDSGASHHVSPNQDLSQGGAAYYGPGKLTVGNGMSLPILHVGNGNLHSSSRPLHLHNVLHVPSVTKNLISVSKLARDNNIFLEFHAKSCLARDEDTRAMLLTGDVVDGLYRFSSSVSLLSACSKQPVVEANVAVKSDSLYTLWHRRLGHPAHESLVQTMASGDISLVPGVEKLWTVGRETTACPAAPEEMVHTTISNGDECETVSHTADRVADIPEPSAGSSLSPLATDARLQVTRESPSPTDSFNAPLTRDLSAVSESAQNMANLDMALEGASADRVSSSASDVNLDGISNVSPEAIDPEVVHPGVATNLFV